MCIYIQLRVMSNSIDFFFTYFQGQLYLNPANEFRPLCIRFLNPFHHFIKS